MFFLRLLEFISYLITLYTYVVIAAVILSWLMGFGVINPYNPYVRALYQALSVVTEPLLRPIRNALPNLGALDISPVVLLLGLFFVQAVVLPSLADLIVR
jgi:YggT family protein